MKPKGAAPPETLYGARMKELSCCHRPAKLLFWAALTLQLLKIVTNPK